MPHLSIEMQEYDAMRNEIKKQKEEIKKLEGKLNQLSEDKLRSDAIQLSYKLMEDYMSAIFEKLGFESRFDATHVESNLEHWLGKFWWRSDRIKFTIGATVTEEFRKAFLNIGIITKKENTEQ